MNDKRFLRRRRRKVQKTMQTHVQDDLNIVYTPPPNLGKTTGWLNIMDEIESDGTILQPDRELRAETAEQAEEIGLNALDIPAFHESPLYQNNEQIRDWRDRGLPPRLIQEMVDVPDDDPYFSVLDADWDEYDIIIGDLVHANLDRVVMDKKLALDDVSIYSTLADEVKIEEVAGEIAEYLQRHNAPVDSVYDLIEASEDVKAQVHDIADNHDSTEDIPKSESITASTNNYVRILSMPRHEAKTTWSETDKCITDDIRKIGYRTDDTLTIISIPMHLRAADSVNVLSATPNLPVIEQFYDEVGLASDVVTTLSKSELQTYFDKYNILQLTKSRRPLSSGWRADAERLETIVDDFEDKVGKTPDVVTTKKARHGPYQDLTSEADGDLDFHHYGEMIGVNKHGDKDAVVVSGAPNYGDDYVRRVAKFCGSTATVEKRENYSDVEWQEDTAQQIFDHMTKDTVLQAIMRFGRKVHDDVDIWVDTSHLPDWVPSWEPTVNDVVRDEPDSHIDVLNELDDEATVSDLFDALDYSKKQIYRALESLVERGYAEVSGSAKYGADVFSKICDELDESNVNVDEALTSSHTDITIRKCQLMQKTEVRMPYEDRTLTTAMGLSQVVPEISATEDTQLALGQF